MRSWSAFKNAFDGEQRCVSSDDQNHPIRYFWLACFCQRRAMEGPHTCSPPSNPHPPEDVIRAKLTVILRLWRPVTGCFELKQKTHYNPKRPWKKLRKYPASRAVRRWVGYSVSQRPSAWSAPKPSPLLSFPFRFYLTGLLVAVTSEFYSFHCRLWWGKKKGTNKLLAGKHSACASLMVS